MFTESDDMFAAYFDVGSFAKIHYCNNVHQLFNSLTTLIIVIPVLLLFSC